MKTKIAIVGSRKITDLNFIENHFFNFLSEIGVKKSDVMVVSGGAKGVDTLAQIIAKRHGIPILVIYPDYKTYGKKAPLVRNVEIIKEADYILEIVDAKWKQRLGKKVKPKQYKNDWIGLIAKRQ